MLADIRRERTGGHRKVMMPDKRMRRLDWILRRLSKYEGLQIEEFHS